MPSSVLVYRTRGARPASAAAFMQVNWRTGSFLSSIRIIIRNRNGDPCTTMRNTRSELRPLVILIISSIAFAPKASRSPRNTAALFSCGIISLHWVSDWETTIETDHDARPMVSTGLPGTEFARGHAPQGRNVLIGSRLVPLAMLRDLKGRKP